MAACAAPCLTPRRGGVACRKLTLGQFWNDTRGSITDFANFVAPPAVNVGWFEQSSGAPTPLSKLSEELIDHATKRFVEVPSVHQTAP